MIKKILFSLVTFGLIFSNSNVSAQVRPMNIAQANPRTMIYHYAQTGNLQNLLLLKRQGYAIDLVDEKGNSALCEATWRQNQIAVDTLIQAGADTNSTCMQEIPQSYKDAVNITYMDEPINTLHKPSKAGTICSISNNGTRTCTPVLQDGTVAAGTDKASDRAAAAYVIDHSIGTTAAGTNEGLSTGVKIGIGIGAIALIGGGIALAVGGGGGGGKGNGSTPTDPTHPDNPDNPDPDNPDKPDPDNPDKPDPDNPDKPDPDNPDKPDPDNPDNPDPDNPDNPDPDNPDKPDPDNPDKPDPDNPDEPTKICNAGEFLTEAETCEKCGLGYYAKHGSNICTPCAVGSYANQLGSIVCTACPIGRSTSGIASTSCDVCATGYKQQGESCLPSCRAGEYWDGSMCAACPQGTFSIAGATTCSKCPDGYTTAEEGSSYCDACQEGYVWLDGFCEQQYELDPQAVCQPGYRPNDNGGCSPCPIDSYGSDGTNCYRCQTGYTTNKTGSTSCDICEEGYYSDNGVCRPHCQAGYYWDGSNCQICAPGSYSSKGSLSCTACSRNSYQPSAGQSTCISCPVGSLTESAGATAIEQCNTCYGGYILKDGSCQTCPAGSYADSSSNTCVQCPIGQYSPSEGRSACSTCPEGQTTTALGSTSCSCDTANGYIAVGDECRLKQYSCEAGNYWDETEGSCQTCEAGTFSASGANYCTACPYGYFNASAGAAVCQACPQGWTTSSNGMTKCDICADGWTMENGQCVTTCPAGQVYNGSACEACPIGSFALKGASSCTLCPQGWTTSAAGAFTCDLCADGYQLNSSTGNCVHQDEGVCDAGWAWNGTECQPCPAGEYSEGENSLCHKCAIGYYSTQEGSASCTRCPVGSTTQEEGSTSALQCNICGIGYSWSASEGKCVTECKNGMFWNGSTCELCPAGTYTRGLENNGAIPTSCQPCSAGTYSAIEGATWCSYCPSHSTSVEGATDISFCTCEDGYYNTDKVTVNCVPHCQAGQRWTGTECVDCAAGTYSSSSGATECYRCFYGSISEAGATSCTSCPEGFSTSALGSDTCDICAAGYEGDGTTCTICSAGTYSNALTNRTCMPCAIGTYISTDGGSSCTACPTGYTTETTGSSDVEACRICSEGYIMKNGKCVANNKSCAAGEYWAGDSCASCAAGTYSVEGSIACLQCPKGTYTLESGSQSCTSCPEGFTTMGFGSTTADACSICAEGYKSDGAGGCVLARETCPSGEYYNGFQCVSLPENAQTDADDIRGWTCVSGYTRVGDNCILTTDLNITTNPQDTTLTSTMTATLSNAGSVLAVNDGTIEISETEGSSNSLVGMKTTGFGWGSYEAYIVNNGTIQMTSEQASLTGIDAASHFADNNGTIRLSSNSGSLNGIVAKKGYNYGQIELTGSKSINGMSSNSYNSELKNYGSILLNGTNSNYLCGISYNDTSDVMENYGTIQINSFEGSSMSGMSGDLSVNYGTIRIQDYQNISTSSSYLTTGMNGGKNYGNLFIDVQNSEKEYIVSGIHSGQNYGMIDIYARNLEKNTQLSGANASTNFGTISIVADHVKSITGILNGNNYGTIRMNTSDTSTVTGLNIQNNGMIEIIASGATNVYGVYSPSFYDTHNNGMIKVTSIGKETNTTAGLYNTKNYGDVYVSGSGQYLYGSKGISASNYGNITLTGSADYVYGMDGYYNSGTIRIDASKTSYVVGMKPSTISTNEGKISIINRGNNAVYGILNYISTTNAAGAEINIENTGNGTAHGISGGYSVYNDGTIRITNTGNGTVYGIDNATSVTNRGLIEITNTGTGQAYGIYLNGADKFVSNEGTISINGTSYTGNAPSGNFIVLENNASLATSGTLSSSGALDLNAFSPDGTGRIALMPNGRVEGESISGDLHIDASNVTNGFKTAYTLSDAVKAKETSNLNLISDSALFNADLADNGEDVIMQMKSFDQVTANKSLADFLTANYAAANNETLFNELKSIETQKALSSAVKSITGAEIMTRFANEDLTAIRDVNQTMNSLMFANNDKPMFEATGALDTFSFKNNDQSSAQYALANKRITPRLKIGYAMSNTNMSTDDDHDTTRRNNIFQVFTPVNYDRFGWQFISTPQIGYARAHYTRQGWNSMSYDGILEKRIFALMNEARYPIDLGKWGVSPTVELNAIIYNQRGHEDKKAFALRIPSDNSVSLEAGLGFYLQRKLGDLNVSMGLMLYREFADPYTMKAGMQEMNGTFDLYDEKYSPYRGTASFLFGYDLGSFNLYGSLKHFIENDTHTHLKAGVKYAF